MCLSTISKRFKRNSDIKIGYKLFRRDAYNKDFYRNIYFDPHTNLKMGEAYTAKTCGYEVPTVDGRYLPFFHIFESLDDAINYGKDCVYPSTTVVVVCEVFAWDIRTTGINNGKKCFVAKSYRLMKEIQYISK